MLLPLHVLSSLLWSILSLTLLLASVFLLYRAARRLRRRPSTTAEKHRREHEALNGTLAGTAVLAPLLIGALLLLFTFAGRHLVQYAFPESNDEPGTTTPSATTYLTGAGSESRGQIDLISRRQTEASPAVVARGTLAMFHWDATPVLPQIPIPILLIVGAQDPTTLSAASEFMRSKIPMARLVEIPKAAHYSLLEQHQQVNTEIDRFITGKSK